MIAICILTNVMFAGFAMYFWFKMSITKINLDEMRKVKQPEAKETQPAKPVCIIGSNPDGQLSIYHEPAGRYAVTFYTPWHVSRAESLQIAIGILENQGPEGIAAAKNFISEHQEL